MSMCAAGNSGKEGTPTFARIQGILNHLIEGKEDLVPLYHGDRLRWTSASDLRDAVVQRPEAIYRLIEPELVGQIGKGHDTLLVRILTGPLVLNGQHYPQMPKNGNIFGQFATTEELDTIALWIEAGCPN